MLCDGESLPVSPVTFGLASSKTPPKVCASPSKNADVINSFLLNFR